MVGGTSRIPLVTKLLIKEVGFDAHKLNRSICEDEAIVNGAAVYAACLSGSTLQVLFLFVYSFHKRLAFINQF